MIMIPMKIPKKTNERIPKILAVLLLDFRYAAPNNQMQIKKNPNTKLQKKLVPFKTLSSLHQYADQRIIGIRIRIPSSNYRVRYLGLSNHNVRLWINARLWVSTRLW